MRAAVICFAAALLAAPAHADPLEGLYGNTVTSTSPSGKVYVYYFNKDGTFENHYPSGRVIKGTFVWTDAQTACFIVTDPPPAKGEDATNCARSLRPIMWETPGPKRIPRVSYSPTRSPPGGDSPVLRVGRGLV